MTSQLDERPAQTTTSTSDQHESPSRPRTWVAATVAVASLAIGGGLIVAATRTDDVPTSVGKMDQAVPVTEANLGALPRHLQEFDAGTQEASTEGAEDRSAYRIIQDEIDKSLAENNRVSTYQPPPPQILQAEIDIALAGTTGQATEEQQERSAYQMIQNEIDAALAKRDSVVDK